MEHNKIHYRELVQSDLNQNYLDLLATKYFLGTLTSEKKEEFFLKIKSNPNHIIYVVEKDSRLIGTATLLILNTVFTQKDFLGKIDDVVVAQEEDDISLIEFNLIEALVKVAKSRGCSKITINNVLDIHRICKSLNIVEANDQILFEI